MANRLPHYRQQGERPSSNLQLAIWINSKSHGKTAYFPPTAKVVSNGSPTKQTVTGRQADKLGRFNVAQSYQFATLPAGSMVNPSPDFPLSLGFCTVRYHPDHGYFGGYLILNTHARPLEFHCTLPVKPTRAQEILYGKTLPDFVCGEQIAKALTSKAKLSPSLVLTDCSAVLALCHVSDQMVACLTDCAASDCGRAFQVPTTDSDRLRAIKLGDHSATILRDQIALESQLGALWKEMNLSMDICEPFDRIAEALVEAHPIMKAA